MELKRLKVFITGADGFIGSHLTETLVSMGVNVRAFVLYNSFNSWGWLDSVPVTVKDSIEVIAGDIRDPHGVRKAMEGCSVVLHLASLIAIPYSYHSPATYVDTNITGTLNVLQAARDLGVSKVVHTSTSEIYGTAQYVPIDEGHPLQGQSPYSASKIGAEKIVESFHTSFGLPTTVIRPFNIYGPRQSTRAVIPTIITQALVKDEIRLGNFAATRDFTYVQDTVNGFIMAAESDAAIGKVFNVGSNYEISIGEIAEKVIRLVGRDVTLVQEEQRIRPTKSEVQRLW